MLTFSCEERISRGNTLSPAELAYIRSRAAAKCNAEYEASYTNFKRKSAEVFDSAGFTRQKGFYHEFKGTSSTRKVDIRIWKQSRNVNELYFYITDDLEGAENYFLRLTQTENEAFIDDLRTDQCEKHYTSSLGTSGPLTVRLDFTSANAPNTDYYSDSYSLSFNYPAIFGRFNKSRSVEKKNSGGVRVGDVLSYTSTFVEKSYDFEGRDVATNSAHYTQKFCELTEDSTVNRYRFTNSTTGAYQSLNLTCTTTVPVDWDLAI